MSHFRKFYRIIILEYGDTSLKNSRNFTCLSKNHIVYITGPDGLNARVLKECSNEISPILALIFNESLARGDVPDEWRQANVSPVFKKR